MKLLFQLSQISKKAIIVTFCLLLFPSSFPSARAESGGDLQLDDSLSIPQNDQLLGNSGQQPVMLLAQANRKSASAAKQSQPVFTHNLEFNRSPIVGNRMRLRGSYAEARLGFTRPRSWNVKTLKALVRFQHSPALYANRSNLTVLINDTSIGSVPLNRRQSQVGQILFNIPPKLLQDYNEIKIVAQQHNSEECTDPGSPDLWTEILPDSKLTFQFNPKPIPLNFSRYPYPLLDELGLEPSKIKYLRPSQVTQSWLTASSRLQASLGRKAEFRPIDTDMVPDVGSARGNDRLVIVGTPREQPILASLKLPVKIIGSQILDRSQSPVSPDTGVLILTKSEKEGGVPILIVTGNGPKGVEKAAQFLAEPDLQRMGTGQVIFVDQIKDIGTPGVRQWPRYLPESNEFKLSDIKTQVDGKSFRDVTVRGSGAPPVEIDFRALPDDRFLRGSSMNLVYSYGPQVNPRTSAVEVLLDGVFIGGARLTSESGENRKNLKVDLPANLIQPDSKLQVFFRMNPREPFDRERCSSPPTQQLSGTVHADTSFDLNRETSVQLPNLELMRFGFPFAAPQDLSRTAAVLPPNPSNTDILTLLAFSERLGRLSQADGVKLDVYIPPDLPKAVRDGEHLVTIGTINDFPLPEVLSQSQGFNLSQAFSRSFADSTIQTPQDSQGMIKQIISPWNGDRVVLALTAQTETGLDRVRQVLNQDPWFFQLKQDTVLIDSDQKNPLPYDPDAYQLAFFQNAPESRRLENTSIFSKASRIIQENWLLLPAGIVGVTLLLYGIGQLYLKRVNPNDSK
ncbi:MAG: cellulose biosynthesis cyclic di-GMP-binding regulatory protein BcsB [Nostocaceae cyanobacterium]|nr:cellulose biosynthesis cyclic di-GMP-binding regulatory protein BcsB [Nostocaceae cyanobacterium]